MRYGQAVRRFFSRRLRDGADVEDLTQEVFARLLKRAEIGDIANIEAASTSTDPTEKETARLRCDTRAAQERSNWFR